jgi:Flp pilus assembly protein TadG
MHRGLISRASAHSSQRCQERGVTIVLVALAMVAIISMAALSIDVITLYLAREEAQRSADQAALAAARILSESGITGDPSNGTGNWGAICGPEGVATKAAKALIAQNTISKLVPGSPNVTYSAGSSGSIGSSTDCSSLGPSAFGVNPMVTVQFTVTGLPTFFSRIWGNSGNSVSASASAEAFNSSNSGTVGNQTTGSITPVQPRCVKPWVVANQEPFNPAPSGGGSNYCNNPGGPGSCSKIVDTSTGQIIHPGITADGIGRGANGIIGETFWLVADCRFNQSGCNLRSKTSLTGPGLQPQANFDNGFGNIQHPPNLLYVPNQVGTSVVSAPSCSMDSNYEEAIGGCDQAINYSCGLQNANTVDLRINPDIDTSNAVQCLTHQNTSGDVSNPSGQDYFNAGNILPPPAGYPFQILAGTANPIVAAGLPTGTPVTSSTSIVSLPIYDDAAVTLSPGVTNTVTFIGFLQVFINAVDQKGNINVTVLNVSGCGNGTNPTGTPVAGTSPVPIRLITPP